MTWRGLSFKAMKKDKLRDATGDKGASALAADAERVGDHWDAIGLVRVEEPNLSPQKGPPTAGENLTERRSSRIVAPPKRFDDVDDSCDAPALPGSAVQSTARTVDDIADPTKLSKKLAALAAAAVPFESDLHPRSREYMADSSAYYKALMEQCVEALKEQMTPIDFGLAASEQTHGAARWHQSRPADYESQARRKIGVNPNPEGGIYGTDLAFKKISDRAAADEKADAKATVKRALDQAWRLCGGQCQCNPAEGEKCPVWDLLECRNCKKLQKTLRECGTCGTCANKRARNASSALAITNA